MFSGKGDNLSCSSGSNVTEKSSPVSDWVELQADAVALATLAADTAASGDSFFVDNDDFDLDRPAEGFASIPEAIEDIRQGKVS